jgi:hypothetical protein
LLLALLALLPPDAGPVACVFIVCASVTSVSVSTNWQIGSSRVVGIEFSKRHFVTPDNNWAIEAK